MVDHISSMSSYVLVDGEQLQADLFDIIFPLGEYDEQSRYLEIATKLVPDPERSKDTQCYYWLDPNVLHEKAIELGLGLSKADRIYEAIMWRLRLNNQAELLVLWGD